MSAGGARGPRDSPSPETAAAHWQQRGACAGLEPDAFYLPEGLRGAARARREELAKTLCIGCPVLLTCRDFALQNREPYGVWGGTTPEERARLLAGEPLPVARAG